MQLRLRVPFWLVRPEDLKVSYGLRQRSALRADNGKSDWQMSRAEDSRARFWSWALHGGRAIGWESKTW